MTNDALPVTVVIPVRDEAINIGKCLSRLTRFSEIVVVDSASRDGTVEIAEAHGARVVQFAWNGRFPKKRNWCLTQVPLLNDWVLFLDADEIVSEAFVHEVSEAIRSDRFKGFWLSYTNYFGGCPLRFGDRQRKLALFQKAAGLYERIEEDGWSSLDMEVHEHPIIDGNVGHIKERIDHNDDKGVYRFLERHCQYAQWEARRLQNLDQSLRFQNGVLTRRQRFKYAGIRAWWFAPLYFVYCYIIRLGFLDGVAGFSYAFYKLWYFFTIRTILLEERTRTPARH